MKFGFEDYAYSTVLLFPNFLLHLCMLDPISFIHTKVFVGDFVFEVLYGGANMEFEFSVFARVLRLM